MKRHQQRLDESSIVHFPGTESQCESLVVVEPADSLPPLALPAPAPASSTFRLDQLKDEYLDKYGENFRLVKLIEEEGLSPAAVVRRLGIKRSPRAVAYLYKRYQKEGRAALADRRWFRHPSVIVLTKQVCEIIIAWYFNRPAAGPRAIWRLTSDTCKEMGLRAPKASTVREYLVKLPEDVKLARMGNKGLQIWRKQAAPCIRYENTTHANDRWQADHKDLHLWVRVKVNGEWRALRAFYTGTLDAHTRAIPNFFVSTKYPDSWSIRIMFWHAIMPKKRQGWKVFGKPKVLQCDRGRDWISKAVETSLSALGIFIDPDAPHYPNSKGKCERFHRTLDTSCLRTLPGHFDDIGRTEEAAQKRVAELLTLPALQQEIEKWIVEKYHREVHSETERCPIEYWEETVLGPVLPEEDELNILLLHSDIQRTIQGFGIRVKEDGIKYLYWSPAFVHHWRERVVLSRNPEDMESVLIYSLDRKLICEAWDMRAESPRYGLADVRQVRREHAARLRGIKHRTRQYMEDVIQNDRKSEQAKEWQNARQAAAALREAEERALLEAPDPAKESEMERLRALFRQQDTNN